MKRIYPLPEVFKGERWVITPGRGECDTVARSLEVPLSEDEADRFVRNHEMAHARITPRVPANKQCARFGVSMTALQCIEDMRVHHFFTQAGIAMTGHLDFYDAQCLVRRKLGSERALAAILCSAWGTEDCNRIINILTPLISDDDVFQQLLNKVRMIHTRLLMGRGITRWIGMRNCTVPAARLFDSFFPPDGKQPADYGDIPIELLRGRVGAGWGDMTIRTLPKSLTHAVVPLSQRRVYRDVGSRLMAPYRLPVDGRVFVQKKRAIGGTVLIDGSGSMSLSADDLRTIVATAPVTTIAIYSGHGKKGSLTIIGEKGRVVDDRGLQEARSSGNGNIVDGPALRWLSMQDAPRIWVSDGLVTGQHDNPSLDLAVEAQSLCIRNRIKRVSKAEAVVDLLKAVTLGGRFHGSS